MKRKIDPAHPETDSGSGAEADNAYVLRSRTVKRSKTGLKVRAIPPPVLPQSSRLLSLPAEIRNQIFVYVYDVTTIVVHVSKVKESTRTSLCLKKGHNIHLFTGAMKACRQLYHEVRQIILAHAMFRLEDNYWNWEFPPFNHKRVIGPFFAKIRYLQVEDVSGWVQERLGNLNLGKLVSLERFEICADLHVSSREVPGGNGSHQYIVNRVVERLKEYVFEISRSSRSVYRNNSNRQLLNCIASPDRHFNLIVKYSLPYQIFITEVEGDVTYRHMDKGTADLMLSFPPKKTTGTLEIRRTGDALYVKKTSGTLELPFSDQKSYSEPFVVDMD